MEQHAAARLRALAAKTSGAVRYCNDKAEPMTEPIQENAAPSERAASPSRALPPQHAILPMRFAALTVGAFLGMHLARVTLSSALPMPAVVAALAFGLAFASLAFDHALSKAIAPRSRRLPLAMRFGLLSAISIVAFVVTERVGMMAFAGATLAIVAALTANEARGLTPMIPPAFVGLALAFGLHGMLSTSRAWVAIAMLAAAAGFTCIAAVIRGGPGRSPARPLDVAWLFGLGTVLALSLKLISQ